MARFSFNARKMREYINKMAALGELHDHIESKALYAATHIYADELRRQTAALPVQNGMAASGDMIHVLSERQKQALLSSIDIYKVHPKRSGLMVYSVGFVGYNDIQTRKYPKGQPNRLIAASVNSGSSVRAKDPFVRRTWSATHEKCVQAMKDIVDAEYNAILK